MIERRASIRWLPPRYSKLTREDKAKIFGLNAARLYGVDVNAQLKALPADAIARFKTAYLHEGGEPENAVHGWVRDDSVTGDHKGRPYESR